MTKKDLNKKNLREGKLFVVYVDDHEDARMMFERTLQRAGADIDLKLLPSGEAAIAWLQQPEREPDMIVLDLNMGKVSGLDVLQWIRRSDYSETPTLIFSGETDPAKISEIYQSHANAYVVKPPELLDYQRVIETINEFWLGGAVRFSGREVTNGDRN